MIFKTAEPVNLQNNSPDGKIILPNPYILDFQRKIQRVKNSPGLHLNCYNSYFTKAKEIHIYYS